MPPSSTARTSWMGWKDGTGAKIGSAAGFMATGAWVQDLGCRVVGLRDNAESNTEEHGKLQ